jgi:hypothetical protein
MGGIADEHVERAIVNRLKAMLDEPPETKFNVTQSFALFSAILIWTKNRSWVGGDRGDRPSWFSGADHSARDARDEMQRSLICKSPWNLSQKAPLIALIDFDDEQDGATGQMNSQFVNMTADAFFKWLRDALAHGDGRNIRPIHKLSRDGGKTLLAGFQIDFTESKHSKRLLTLSLYHADMKRIGSLLADLFCRSLSGENHYFDQEAGTAFIQETAQVA